MHTEPLFKKTNILTLNLLQNYFALDFMQQKHQGFLPPLFDNQFLTYRQTRENPDRELRNDCQYAVLPPRLKILKRFPAFNFPEQWNIFYNDNNLHNVSVVRERNLFKKLLKKTLLSELKENVACERLFCPSCMQITD